MYHHSRWRSSYKSHHNIFRRRSFRLHKFELWVIIPLTGFDGENGKAQVTELMLVLQLWMEKKYMLSVGFSNNTFPCIRICAKAWSGKLIIIKSARQRQRNRTGLRGNSRWCSGCRRLRHPYRHHNRAKKCNDPATDKPDIKASMTTARE